MFRSLSVLLIAAALLPASEAVKCDDKLGWECGPQVRLCMLLLEQGASLPKDCIDHGLCRKEGVFFDDEGNYCSCKYNCKTR
ncbi:hypothetical protein PRIPAC_91358 [Pristionchus pacificus]|uniref:Uncharacterized protein n=1 Tax=Pristionchus pacificus TaxID=54126 RepID=A0A454XLU1_PRIPA|nr:hypothetical protein PRIPAC_91358 [Pristionchus pacificus]|eukprot:PDM61381.1 hypothetical protein PRIPAC_50823 [Pristionchus pacificus]